MKRFYSFAIAVVLILEASSAVFGQRDAIAQPWQQVNLVRLHSRVAGARAVGVFAACDKHLAPEECAFTVESVRYTVSGPAAAPTKFDALCVDIGFPDAGANDAWNCSPVTREGLAVFVDAGAGGSLSASGGLGTGVASGVGSIGEVSLGLGVALPISARLQVPMARHVSNGGTIRLGGNILIEAGLNSVAAGQTVVFGHTSFDGGVTFMVNRPAAMSLSIGYVGGDGQTRCESSRGVAESCPTGLDRALRSACEVSAGGACSSAPDAPLAPTTAFGPEIDFDELKAAMQEHQELMGKVNSHLQESLPDKATEVFALLDADDDDDPENPTAALPRLRIFAKVKAGFQKILAKVDEIKETVQEHVPCPF